jgi:hypothetical protein
MKQCPKCGKKFADHVKFCQTDGTPLVEMIDPSKRLFCSHCGAPNDKKSKFCKSCGKPMDAAKPQATPQPNQQPARATIKPSDSIPEKPEVSVPPQQPQPVTPAAVSEETKSKAAPMPEPLPTRPPIQSPDSRAETASIITPVPPRPSIQPAPAGKIGVSHKTPKKNNLLLIGIVAFIVLLLAGTGFYFRSYLYNLLPTKQVPQEHVTEKEDTGQALRTPVRVENAFPFEGGQLGVWYSKKELTAYASEGNTSTVAFIVAPGEKFEALERNIHVEQPGIVKINDSVQIFVRDKSPEGKALEQRGLQKGDTIGLICPAGEGFSYILVNGKVASFEAYNVFDTTPPKAEYIRKEGNWTLWVKVKNKWGNTGWIPLSAGDYSSIVGGSIYDEASTTIPFENIVPSVTSTPAEPKTSSTISSGNRPAPKPEQPRAATATPPIDPYARAMEIKKYLQEGKEYYYQGKYELCIAKMEEVLKREPSHTIAQQFIRDARVRLQQ